MSDRIDDLGRDAAAAVRDATAGMGPADGLDAVVRRGRRRKLAAPVTAVAATLAVVALAVPAVSWLFGGAAPVGLEVADAPVPTDDGGDGTPATDDGPPDAAGEQDPPGGPETGDGGLGALSRFSFDDVVTDGFPGGGGDVVLLTDVRLGARDGFDRFVLEFDGQAMSPYRVGRIEPPVRADGSGEVVQIRGGAFIEVVLAAASGVEFDPAAADGYRLTYEGPGRVEGATMVITEAVRTGDFEATLTWTIGLREPAPFAVTVLESPLRLVVDVAVP